MRKSIALVMAALLLILSLVGCQNNTTNNGNNSSDGNADNSTTGDTIKIGFFGTLAGSGAYVDMPAKLALEDYIAELNANGGLLGRQLELVSYDVSRDPATESVTATNRLIQQDDVIAILGPSGTASTLPIISICNENQVPVITNAATNPAVTVNEETGEVYPYIFRVCFIDSYQGTALADFAYNDLGITKIATLTRVNNAYAQGVQEFFHDRYLELGGELVEELGYQEGEVEFRAQLTKAADAGATALFVAASEYKDAALIATQAADLGLEFTFLMPDGVYASEMLDVAGAQLEGAYISVGASEDDPAFAEFKSTFDETHASSGYTANIYTYYMMDAMKLLEWAINDAGSFEGADIRDSLENAKDVPAFTETLTIDPATHNPLNKSITVLKIEDSQYTVYKNYKPGE